VFGKGRNGTERDDEKPDGTGGDERNRDGIRGNKSGGRDGMGNRGSGCNGKELDEMGQLGQAILQPIVCSG